MMEKLSANEYDLNYSSVLETKQLTAVLQI